ncbi:MAG: DNA gyrase subunit A [Oscillospiraceae bacterium]|nr:DNA gyrase subunit A [Oscillospiraceae bacterium]
MEFENEKIILVDIEKEMKKSFLDYSMSVIVSRALPDVRDGLKPVHRRILYTMYENGLYPEKAYRKCADTVGSVLGRYHPHGDASVYDALVRLAQHFSMRYMLVDGHGNFGSVDGDPPAAYRYTEAKMGKISMEMLADIDKDTVDFSPNFDDRLKEPQVLPARYPNLLVNGTTGIAVGMATNIPPHNMGEAIDGMCCLIDNPEATLDDLMEHIKGPDFPTSAIIMGRAGIRAAYGTGRGHITVRARAEIEEAPNNRFRIVVTELPYQVNKANLIIKIAELVKEKRIDGITAVDDHSSDREGMRVVIDLRRDASPQVVLNNLYTLTQMQTTFGVIQLAIVNGEPKILTLKQMLEEYIKFQVEVVVRRTLFELRKAKERAHILEGLKIALDYIDEVIAIIRSSKGIPESKSRLIERFGLDDVQATAIVNMRLGQLSALERDKIEEELAAIQTKIGEFEEIIASEARQREIVRDEAMAVKAKFADERRTEILTVSGEVDIEDLIAVEDCVITLTAFGYVKRQKTDTYQTQHRGGRGISGMTRREEDVATEMFIGSTHDYILFFSNLGRVYRLKGYEIPESARTSKGINIANLLPISSDEKITSMIKISAFEEDKYLVMVTQKGNIKRTALNAYNTARKGGLIALDLDEGDRLAWVRLTDGKQQLIVATKSGMAIRFSESDVRVMGRLARGVRSIRLKEGDSVAGMSVLREGGMILTVTETGFGRLSPAENYRIQNRGGSGIKNYRCNLYGDVAAIKVVDENDDVIVIAENGVIIRIAVAEIRQCARPAKGVRIMRIGEDNRVVTIARLPHDDEEELDTIEDEGDAEEGAELLDEDIIEEIVEETEE